MIGCKIAVAIGFGFLSQCSPVENSPVVLEIDVTEITVTVTEPDITVMLINESDLGGRINVPPYTRLWVKMDGQNWNPDMRFRCANMGGYLVDDVCHNVDY